jgi:hypothetical protein
MKIFTHEEWSIRNIWLKYQDFPGMSVSLHQKFALDGAADEAGGLTD